MSRTAKQRLEAMEPALKRGEEFCAKVRDAEGDVLKCADLMAEAIAIGKEARGLETVRRDGRAVMCMEELQCCYCMDAAREAYLRARAHGVQVGDVAPIVRAASPSPQREAAA